MAFLFTADAMQKFWTLYQSPEGSNSYGFVNNMQSIFNVAPRDATLIWQSFDVCEGFYMGKMSKMSFPTVLKFECRVCGKIGSGRTPKGGDVNFYYPRKHSSWIENENGMKEFHEVSLGS